MQLTMNLSDRSMRMIKLIGYSVLLVGILFGFRLMWHSIFPTPEHPSVSQGVLDLRGWDFGRHTITLDGEWEFFQDELLTQDELAQSDKTVPSYITVPGKWNGAPDKPMDESYGIGTYRLRILIDSDINEPLAFWIQRIKTASQLEINGKPEKAIGAIAENKADYSPRTIPYTATVLDPLGTNEIELLVRAANFDDPFAGGIVRSVRFGTLAAVDTQRWYSVGFQLTTFLILMLHALYAAILYFFNRGERMLLIFFGMVVSAAATVIVSHDSLFQLWLPVNYTWTTKSSFITYTAFPLFMVLMSRALLNVKGGKLFHTYLALFALALTVTAVSDVQTVHYLIQYRIFALLYLLPLLSFLYYFVVMYMRNHRDSWFLLFASASVASSMLWGVYNTYNLTVSIYYPLDVIIAIIAFSSYWFKRYFRNSQEKARLAEQLQMADKLKDQFLANTSHELRTPLHGIINIAQSVAAKEQHVIGAKSYDDLELLGKISRRMSRMLDDLLDLAQLKDNRITLRREPLSVQAIGGGVIGMLHYMSEGKPVKLVHAVPDGLPSVFADEKRLVQILFNLIHNSLKFTEQGQVVLSAESKGNAVLIHVSDTGIGIDESTRERIFMAYEQGAPGITSGGGIGLGLSICKQLVELHGSRLTVRSRPGDGTIFSFALPIANAGEQPLSVAPDDLTLAVMAGINPDQAETLIAQSAAARADMPDNHAAIRRGKDAYPPFFESGAAQILAVDDDPVNLKVLETILSSESFLIRTASSAKEALHMLHQERWDLVIADVMMPHMSGYELTRIVREKFPSSELPILLLTARGQTADTYTGFLSGANDYVTKPVDATELKYRVQSLISLKQSADSRLQMEAAYLQAQIHPHFLFNTLNSIMALSELDTEKMRRLGDAFTTYLRISFNFLNLSKLVPLSRELELVRAYLYIEKERFEERLTIKWDIDSSIELMLPPLTIQPIVENAVRHGVMSRSTGGEIIIRIRRKGRATLVEIIDNGKGMDADKLRLLLDPSLLGKGGIGLANTNRRLAQMYGAGLAIRSKPGAGTVVSFLIPEAAAASAPAADDTENLPQRS